MCEHLRHPTFLGISIWFLGRRRIGQRTEHLEECKSEGELRHILHSEAKRIGWTILRGSDLLNLCGDGLLEERLGKPTVLTWREQPAPRMMHIAHFTRSVRLNRIPSSSNNGTPKKTASPALEWAALAIQQLRRSPSGALPVARRSRKQPPDGAFTRPAPTSSPTIRRRSVILRPLPECSPGSPDLNRS
jgi:hypothetical protein